MKDIKNLILFVPPLIEQKQITEFLDKETAKLDSQIKSNQKLIELLKEKRQATINQAVTKGLDPTVPMKDSGIEWIGEIPEDWDIIKLKYANRINPTKSEVAYLPDDFKVSFLPMEKIGEDGNLFLDETIDIGEAKNGFTYFKNDDIIVAKITPCFENGKGSLCKDLVNGIGFGTTELHVLRPYGNFDSLFEFYWTRSHSFLEIGESLMYGSAGQKRIPTEFINYFEIAYPKTLQEQKDIAEFLDKETSKIDHLISKTESQIEKLQEYRQSLISAAVTGKIDVRNFSN